MDASSLGFRTDLMVLRLGGSEIVDRGDYVVARTASNPTFYWGNFLLVQAPIGDVTGWLERFAAEFPDANHRAIGVDSTDARSIDRDRIAGAGLEVEVSTVLTATSLHRPSEPAAECRELVSDRDWRAVETVRCAVYGLPSSPAEADFQHRKVVQSRDVTQAGHGAWFGAFIDGDLVASLGIVSDGSGLARYQSVETHPDYRRRGLARKLLYDASKYAIDHLGATRLVIVADPEESAITLYRSAGFTDSEDQIQLLSASE